MTKFLGSIFIVVLLSSCSKKTALQEEFICDTHTFSNTEKVADFKNKFNITIPKHWKTQLYFDTIQTQIITADTTKNFTNTYTINIEYNSGDLKIDDAFKTQIKTDLQNKQQYLLKSKVDYFKEKPCYWTVSKGKKQKFDYYYFELFVKQTKTHYFKITSEIYGNENISDRFCESVALIETLEVLD